MHGVIFTSLQDYLVATHGDELTRRSSSVSPNGVFMAITTFPRLYPASKVRLSPAQAV